MGRHKGFKSRPLCPPTAARAAPAPALAQQGHVFFGSQRPPLLSISYGTPPGFKADSSSKAGEMGSVGSEGACPLSSPPCLSPHKKYLSQQGFLRTSPPPRNPTANALTDMHVQGCVVPRCEMCCERGTRESQSAETGGYQYLCMFLSPPAPSWSLVTNPPVSHLPRTSVTSYFSPTFPPRLAFWKGRDGARLKHDCTTNVGFTWWCFIWRYCCQPFAAPLSVCNPECNSASLRRRGE